MLPLLIACSQSAPPPGPGSWSTIEDCRAQGSPGLASVCYAEVLPAVICADPAQVALLEEVPEPDFRDAVLSRVTREHFPTTDAFCAQIADDSKRALCREVVVSARLRGQASAADCAAPPMVDLPRAEWCACTGPDSRLRITSPAVHPPEADLNAVLTPIGERLLRCQREKLYPQCPCWTGEVRLTAMYGKGVEVVLHDALPAAAAACFEEALKPRTDGVSRIDLTVSIAP